MSEQQIKKILERLDAQDDKIDKIFEQNKRQFQMIEPMYEIFGSVEGFNKIAVYLLKGLILISAGVGVVYGLIEWLKH